MRKVLYVLLSLLFVSVFISVVPLQAFSAEDIYETHVECDVNGFMDMNGEMLAESIEYFINTADIDLFIAVRESLNGEKEISDQAAEAYLKDRYSDFLSNRERGALVLMLLSTDSGSGWRFYAAENDISRIFSDEVPPVQLYFDECIAEGYGTETSLGETVRLLADGMVFGFAEHAVEPMYIGFTEYDDREFDPDAPFYGLSEEEYAAISEMVPDFSNDGGFDWEAFAAALPKAVIGILAALIKVFLKKTKGDNKKEE